MKVCPSSMLAVVVFTVVMAAAAGNNFGFGEQLTSYVL